MKAPDKEILIARRQFIKASGLVLASLGLAGCEPNIFEADLKEATEPLNQTLEQALFNKFKVSNFPKSAIEPKALIINTYEHTMPVLPEEDFRLAVGGLVERQLSLSLADLKACPYTSAIIRHVCVEGWAAIVQWGGVPISHLAKLAGAKANVKYAYFYSAGNTYYESWDIASCLHPQTILAYEKNFEPLPAVNGGPLRLASPVKLGYKQSKWVIKLDFLAELPAKKGFWEDAGYEWYAGL